MTYDGVIVTVAEMTLMCGENVDATGYVEANQNIVALHAESYLSSIMHFNLTTGFAGLNAAVKSIVSEWAARYAAITFIAFNMAGFTTRQEAEDMIDIHAWRMAKIEELLRQPSNVTYIKGV